MKKAPKSKLKATIKTKSKTDLNMRPASEAMVELGIRLFFNKLAVEARTKAFEDKSLTIRAHHIPAVSKMILKKSRG